MVRTIPFIERRRFRRADVRGTMVAVTAAQAVPPDRAALSTLDLSDVSDGGLSAISLIQLAIASPVTVLLPPSPLGQPDGLLAGRVVRCRARGRGYQVAVAFDRPPTVAG